MGVLLSRTFPAKTCGHHMPIACPSLPPHGNGRPAVPTTCIQCPLLAMDSIGGPGPKLQDNKCMLTCSKMSTQLENWI